MRRYFVNNQQDYFKIEFSLLFSHRSFRAGVDKKNFGKICVAKFHLTYPLLINATHVALHS